MDPIIKVNNLDKVFELGKSNEYHAMRKINIEIYPKEYIIFFGPSGCGKSTLLYSILGILPPTAGEILVNGESIYNYTQKEMVRYQTETIGIIYQAFYLIPSLSIIDNVSLPLIFSNVDEKQRQQRAMELMKRFGVDKQAEKLPSALSGGQLQRVAVSRSLVSDPNILLADEPVGNLDSKSTKAVMDTLKEINEVDNKTIILVTHDAKHLAYAHRIFYLRDGALEREVVNPQKKQIKEVQRGKTVFTEIDKLSSLFPYSSPEELRIKSIVNYLTQELNFDQLQRIEAVVQKMVAGRIEKSGFLKLLLTPFDEGGVGITRATANSFAEKIEKILFESKDITRFRRTLNVADQNESLAQDKQKELVKRLRASVLDQYEGQVNLAQVRRIEGAIEKRIVGETKGNDFQAFLNLSFDKSGVGFNSKTARRLTDYLEKLLAQGVMDR